VARDETIPRAGDRVGLPDRETALERAAATRLDVLVIGGGITGAGVALDAASRGYRVALVERGDLASGTSSRSSKLVHGGLRYLATGDLPMVAEGVRERDRLRRLAPHLVRPLSFTVPVADARERAELKTGMLLYDGIALGRNVRSHRRLSPEDLAAVAPGLVCGRTHGGYRYHDAQTDDARLTLQVAQTARRLGALVVNHAEVVTVEGDAGRVVGARVRDRLTGGEVDLRARWVVSAGGVWTDALRDLAPHDEEHAVVPAKGVHIVLDRAQLPVRGAVVIPSADRDGRRLFVVPWGEQVYVGTTDDVHAGDLDHAVVTASDAAYLLDAVSAAFATDLGPEDAIGAWAGLRPLRSPASGSAASTDLSRRHAIVEDPPGLVSITGGKLTTYRRMAEDLVDRLAAADGAPRPGVTTGLHLGVAGPPGRSLARTVEAGRSLGVPERLARGAHHRHGDAAPAVLRFCAEHDGATPLVEGLPYLTGELRWAVRHELARTVDDLLSRRTRVALRHAAAGGDAVGIAGGVLAEELGLTADEVADQGRRYLDGVRAERGPVPLTTGR
jgi:glycerol-3-phosphate dehydrogenase